MYDRFGTLHLFDLKAETSKPIPVRVVADLPGVRPKVEKVAQNIQKAGLSPTGTRALFEARGEILTVPAEKGDIRNLTNSPGVAERDPAWSPDGKSIAFFSDESGDYELPVRAQELKAQQVPANRAYGVMIFAVHIIGNRTAQRDEARTGRDGNKPSSGHDDPEYLIQQKAGLERRLREFDACRAQGRDGNARVVILMAALQPWRRQIEQAIVILIDEASAFLVDIPMFAERADDPPANDICDEKESERNCSENGKKRPVKKDDFDGSADEDERVQ